VTPCPVVQWLQLVDAIESAADLADLQRWLAVFCDVKKSLFFCLSFGVLVGFYGSVLFFHDCRRFCWFRTDHLLRDELTFSLR